ncbi:MULTISPECIES: hypothetical protein [unclassified Bradyrhizobium]|uniref:hypothetical protein n=1 Tax=unclassified Bradyrhizobium TaxID=2631580 RepID=UPI002306BE93|nr:MULTISPECIES: hypothetical protein [unclassified Bradyrhizobium]
MAGIVDPEVPGFFAPVHRALTDPILMGGRPAPWRSPEANNTSAVRYSSFMFVFSEHG